MRDYLAAVFAKPGDKVDYGVIGMKWGRRRSRSELRTAAEQRKPSTPSSPEKKPAGNIQDHVESSQARYSRLKAQAAAGGASKMTDQDLKFFNARTEALAKINKLNEQNPGWLATTTKKVIQSTAERQMQSVSNALADKYVGGPLIGAIKGKPDTKKDTEDTDKVDDKKS